MSSHLRSSQCYVTQHVRISPDTNIWSMFKPSLQNETLQKGVYQTHFSSVNTNHSHKNVTQTSHVSLLFHIFIVITANSGYLYDWLFLLLAGTPFCSCRRACKASTADTKKILWFASCCVHTFNSVTKNSTARAVCWARTYKNMFKHNYYANIKLGLLVATCYKKV